MTSIRETALKRMQRGIGRSESGRPYIDICAQVAEEMVMENLRWVDDSLLASQTRGIYAAFAEQVRKHGGADVPGSTMPNGTNDRRYAVLGEEVGEVANALNELHLIETDGAYKRGIDGKPTKDWEAELRKELTDVATVAVAWLYWLDAALEVSDAPA